MDKFENRTHHCHPISCEKADWFRSQAVCCQIERSRISAIARGGQKSHPESCNSSEALVLPVEEAPLTKCRLKKDLK